MDKTDIKIGDKVFMQNNPFPFEYRGVNEKGNPVLFGDFSNGFFGVQGWIESDSKWEEIYKELPRPKNYMRGLVVFRELPKWEKNTKIKIGVPYNYRQESRGLGEYLFTFFKDDKKVGELYLDYDQLEDFAYVTSPRKPTDEWHEIK